MTELSFLGELTL